MVTDKPVLAARQSSRRDSNWDAISDSAAPALPSRPSSSGNDGSPGSFGVWREVAATLRPRPNSRDGPLPPLLLTLTVVTGLVDATSYLKLGHVFVANMTGNVVFLGFGIAGAGGISVWASLTALGSFLVGGVVGGRIGARWSSNRGRHLAATTSTELLLVAGALVVAALSTDHIGTGSRYAVIILLAIAMAFRTPPRGSSLFPI
jgi:hypothetical protein